MDVTIIKGVVLEDPNSYEKYPLSKLEIGEGFYIPAKDIAADREKAKLKIRQYIYNAGRRIGGLKKFKSGFAKDDKSTIGITRTK